MLVSASNGATTKLSLLNSQTNFRIYLNPEVFYGLKNVQV
ncbi:hypothetical protein SALWKB2_2296 [Snodgrassella alvi wkB2]|nr:hypothetical protein SALWKB2_2296 [Snodgrassella alvi wkB2]